MRTVYLGRQPIFNGDLKPVAYELLYRAGATDHSDKSDVRASANVLISAFLEMGVQRVVGKVRAFIHVTPEILDDDLLRLFDPAQLVLQLGPTWPSMTHCWSRSIACGQPVTALPWMICWCMRAPCRCWNGRIS